MQKMHTYVYGELHTSPSDTGRRAQTWIEVLVSSTIWKEAQAHQTSPCMPRQALL